MMQAATARPPLARRHYRSLIGATGLLAILLASASCAPRLEVPAERSAELATSGMIRSVEYVGGYPGIVLRLMVWWEGLSEEIPTQYGISLYRVEYWTTGPSGERTYASGLISFPRHDSPRGVVSYQHGTAVQRAESPSAPNLPDWVPRAPIHLYYGTRDVDTSPEEARVEAERLSARGGDVRAISVGDFDHEGSVVPGIPAIRAWFDELASGAAPRIRTGNAQ